MFGALLKEPLSLETNQAESIRFLCKQLELRVRDTGLGCEDGADRNRMGSGGATCMERYRIFCREKEIGSSSEAGRTETFLPVDPEFHS
jgi:hypothetical protein